MNLDGFVRRISVFACRTRNGTQSDSIYLVEQQAMASKTRYASPHRVLYKHMHVDSNLVAALLKASYILHFSLSSFSLRDRDSIYLVEKQAQSE